MQISLMANPDLEANGQGKSMNQVPSKRGCYKATVKACRSSRRSGSAVLGLSPLSHKPAGLLYACKGGFISFQVSGFHQPILTFVTSARVFSCPCVVCRGSGSGHVLKKHSSPSGGGTLPRSALGASRQQQMGVDWTESSETLYCQAEIVLELSQSKELFFFFEISFSIAD